MAKAFAITSLPFIAVETTTGVVSLLTGQLSIPPLLGIGTSVDMVILMAGLGVGVLRALTPKEISSDAEATDRWKSR